MNESEQAQAIEDMQDFLQDQFIEARMRGDYSGVPQLKAVDVIAKLLGIVDYQSKEIENLKEQVKVTARQVHDAAQLRL